MKSKNIARIKLLLVGCLLAISMATVLTVAISNGVMAYTQGQCDAKKTSRFFGMPTWYKYLPVKAPDCNIEIKDKVVTSATDNKGKVTYTVDTKFSFKSLMLIALAIIEILLVLAGILAVIFVMIGGFNYIISQGEPDKIAKAKNTIINALVGAVIAIIASQVVVYIGSAFGAGSPDDYGLIHVPANSSNLQIILSILFAIIGAVSVFMIVLAGFNFIVSGGNAEKIAKARRTIYYSLIGLIISIFASVIVSFLLKKVT